MKAIICTQYGPSEASSAEEVEKPCPGEDEVLIKILAASLNAFDWRA